MHRILSLRRLNHFAMALVACGALGGATVSAQTAGNSITKTNFGALADGTQVDIFTLRNAKGMEARIMNYGGIIVSLQVPDRAGAFTNVVLGFTNFVDYTRRSPYFGAIVGRYGNRIAKAKFTLNGKEYTLAANNGPNHLHGGAKGFDKVVWTAKTNLSAAGPELELTYLSKDGEEGYPGNLTVKAVYLLTSDNTLRLDFTGTTDADTVLNLTQHSYFNLAGGGDIFGHEFFIDANKFTPMDSTLIPTGELRPVTGTPFDFTKPATIKARLDQDDEQLRFGRGYDANFVLNKMTDELSVAARVAEPVSGRVVEILTTQPAIQFYTSTVNSRQMTGTNGARTAFCLEAQHYPDSPNHPDFPTTVLQPGQTYRNTIIWRFSTQK